MHRLSYVIIIPMRIVNLKQVDEYVHSSDTRRRTWGLNVYLIAIMMTLDFSNKDTISQIFIWYSAFGSSMISLNFEPVSSV